MNTRMLALPALFAFALAPSAAHATNGYFSHGYGVKSQGMGGVGIALPQDAIAAASNPAGMALIGDRMDMGMTWFRPQRESEISGNQFPGVDGTYEANDKENFFIPEFGYNRMMNDNLSLGVTVYGHGGMNTSYERPIPLLGTSKAGVDLAQLFIAPTLAWKVTPSQTLGVSLNLAYQRFEARGLQNFQAVSSSLGNVTNNGHDSSYGAGVRVGWTGQVTDSLTLGATYQSKTKMSAFDDYKGLFAEDGDFDIPSNFGVGLAFKATDKLTLAADVVRINYTDVDSVANNSLANLYAGHPLGASNGPGFGWNDMTVYKLGVSYAWSSELTLRAGYNHGKQPIERSQTLFNILAPGVPEDHITLGATWTLPNKGELSVAYMHAFENTVDGRNSIPPGFPPAGMGGGNADLKMYQDSLGIAYGWNF